MNPSTAHTTTPAAARQALTEHPRYHYRGCAPDMDEPTQAAGNLDLSVDAWSAPDADGGEPQRDRIAREKAAIEVCLDCPVMVQCLTYASSYTVDPATNAVHLTEPEGIWGGTRALERHRQLIASRVQTEPSTQTLSEARTPQKQAVLVALAGELYETRVAAAAGMDVRTANWHRSALCTLLGLKKETASRDDLLAAAIQHDLLPAGTRVVWDGLWPIAAAPNTDGSRQRHLCPEQPLAMLTPRARAPRSRRRPAATRPHDTAGPGRRSRLRVVPTLGAPQLPTPATLNLLGAAA